MSELLNSLNVPSEAPAKSWASEVAEAAVTEPAPVAAETAAPEPAPSQPETPEPAVEASETQETAPEEHDRRVPLKALQEERQKRAEYERQLQEYQRREQEWQQWAEQQRQAQQQPEEQYVEPDPETDPIGALKAARDQLRSMQQETQQRAYVEQLNTVAYQAATEYQQQVPDYQDAYKYAINSRAQELVALGTHPQAVSSILQQEELRLIDTALQNRKNPAEAIYQFAKARGFQGKTAPAPAPAPVQAIAPDPVLAETKRAVAASASAGGAPASKGQVSISDLANLNGAAFDAAWNKMFAATKSSVFRE